MSVSDDLAMEFAKIIKENTRSQKEKKETTVYGTAVSRDGSMFVKLDGANRLTPMTTTADVEDGERVMVMIKNHTATITGNLSTPSARSSALQEIGNKVSNIENITIDGVTREEFNAEKAKISSLQTSTSSMSTTLTTHGSQITDLQTYKLSKTEAEGSYAKKDLSNVANKTIEPSKINITDLSEFNVSIGHLTLGSNSIYSGTKNSISNTESGIYFDKDGQFAIGDGDNFVKYYKDQNGVYKLETSLMVGGGSDGGLDETAVQALINASIENLNIPSDSYINSLINTALTGFNSGTITPLSNTVTNLSTQFSGVKTKVDDISVYCDSVDTVTGWNIEEYSDGTVKLWKTISLANLTCNTALGSMFRTPVITTGYFPFQLCSKSNPDEPPVVTTSYESDGYGALLWATTRTTYSSPPSYYLVRPTSTTIASGVVNVHVYGKRK